MHVPTATPVPRPPQFPADAGSNDYLVQSYPSSGTAEASRNVSSSKILRTEPILQDRSSHAIPFIPDF